MEPINETTLFEIKNGCEVHLTTYGLDALRNGTQLSDSLYILYEGENHDKPFYIKLLHVTEVQIITVPIGFEKEFGFDHLRNPDAQNISRSFFVLAVEILSLPIGRYRDEALKSLWKAKNEAVMAVIMKAG